LYISAKLTNGSEPKAASAASTLSMLRLPLELLDESSDTMLRAVSDIAADNRVDTRRGIHKDGSKANRLEPR
jgi:hypothetical protein